VNTDAEARTVGDRVELSNAQATTTEAKLSASFTARVPEQALTSALLGTSLDSGGVAVDAPASALAALWALEETSPPAATAGVPASATPHTLESLFAALDDNGDGVLSQQEVVHNAQKLGLTPHEAAALFHQLDAQQMGYLTRGQFNDAGFSAAGALTEATLASVRDSIVRGWGALAGVSGDGGDAGGGSLFGGFGGATSFFSGALAASPPSAFDAGSSSSSSLSPPPHKRSRGVEL
jgi:hypothetical protein